ncbi:radical SAM protein [Clostridium cellulovorans]|uniref:Elongator protein 3/MiaB/NifB n=1 Tax=Clostridium cellulovorans (strain ATCC 35296 / DSM 3052 / OCM 3 / 743B) TaxID=573061 RepID=D9SVW7_CLOC7|nr:radical SAM protein [Clostridium cellulovorans]ADL53178.1 Elongator protein 3/MiaB/NifB [Clostridium cellulovorans 743B]
MSDIKEILYKELELKAKVNIEGINADPKIFKHLDLGGEYQEQIHSLFEMDHQEHVGISFPCGFISPNGLRYNFCWDVKSRFSIKYSEGKYYLAEDDKELFQVEFDKRPHYYSLKTSDGTAMSHVASFTPGGTIGVAYSNECALKDKGLDCLFCNANATKDTYAAKENITWKNPKQIGEAVAAAFKYDNGKHVNITGGFIPERREVDYYIDVAEAIQEHTGLEDFNGTAVIGAPEDLSVIDKYKEAGFRTIAIQLEIWDQNIFKTICPGKQSECGGWQHWVDALEYAVKVFGFGKVRTGFVTGIEPKNKTLEGVEYFASKGILSLTNAWNPNPGSKLEGHRTPTPEWHLDMAKKTYAIFKKAGFTYEQYFDVSPSPDFLVHDIYRIEEQRLPIFKEKNV